MAVKTLKTYQAAAIDSAVAVFDQCRTLLATPGIDQASRATAIFDNGYLLIEAPTGSGKTLMAGFIAERMSELDRVVWFWFAPFRGVVDQSAAFLREQFQGLRLRTLSEDRNGIGTRSGDVFVTTWSLVATRVRDRRSVRQTGELNGSVDDLVDSLREQGFHIGVVVDEAHHGFHGDTQAAAFFRTVLRPEFTVLVTATPDDHDLADLQERMQIGNLHRIRVSRTDAVEAGLIKRGIKCIAWRAEPGSSTAVDLEQTALKEATALHKLLKSELQRSRINLVPLLLVQVDSKPKSVEKAKERLIGLGFSEGQIAVHTSEEPDAGLLALANDETREVLIFKMAVALGFDAPRAWTLVSMRAARDADFGVQLVGRILRVHRRLQGRSVPEALQCGYVLLADPDAQGGLDAAGQRINQLQTTYASVSRATVIVQVGDRTQVQMVSGDGQMSMVSTPPAGSIWEPPTEPGTAPTIVVTEEGEAATLWTPEASAVAGGANVDPARAALRAMLAEPPPASRFRYRLRDGVPRRFLSQELPDDLDVTAEQCAQHFAVSAEQLWDAHIGRTNVPVEKRTVEIFTQMIQMELTFAAPSKEQMQRQAQKELLRNGYFSAKELRAALFNRVRVILRHRGASDAEDDGAINEYLNVLLSQHPEILRKAQQDSLQSATMIQELEEIPSMIESDDPLPISLRNVYGVMPADTNSWEKDFGEFLDRDDTGSVLWWHRNPPRKSWSINVVLPDGRGFFPDFIIGINDRPTPDHGLLVDPKYGFDTANEIPKILARHAEYGRALIISRFPNQPWRIVGINAATNRAEATRPLRLYEMAAY